MSENIPINAVHGLSTATAESFRSRAESQALPSKQESIALTPAQIESGLTSDTGYSYRPQIPIYSFTTQSSPTLYFYRDVENMLRDGVVCIPLQYFIAPLSFAEFEIEASSRAVTDWGMEGIKWFWDNMFHLQWYGYAYGWDAGEMIYGIEDGLLKQKALHVFHPRDVQPLTINKKYCGVQVMQTTGNGGPLRLWGAHKGVPAKAFWYAHNQQFNRLYGNSQISPSWRYWTRLTGRDGVEEINDLGTYRMGVGVIQVRYPQEDMKVNAGGRNSWGGSGRISAKMIAQELGENIKSGGNIAMPSEVWENSREYKWSLEYITPQINIQQLSDREKDLRRKVSDCIGWPSELFESADGGTGFSGRKMPFISLLLRQNTIGQYLVNAWLEQIGTPCVKWNFGAKAWLKIKMVSLVEIFTKLSNGQQMAPGQAPATPPVPPPATKTPVGIPLALPPTDMKTLLYSFMQEMAAAKNGDPQAAQSASLIRDQIRSLAPSKLSTSNLSFELGTKSPSREENQKKLEAIGKENTDFEEGVAKSRSKLLADNEKSPKASQQMPKAFQQIMDHATNGTLTPEVMGAFVDMVSDPNNHSKFTSQHLLDTSKTVFGKTPKGSKDVMANQAINRGREYIASTRQRVAEGETSTEPIEVQPIELPKNSPDDFRGDVSSYQRMQGIPETPYPEADPIPLDQLPQNGKSQYPPIAPVPVEKTPGYSQTTNQAPSGATNLQDQQQPQAHPQPQPTPQGGSQTQPVGQEVKPPEQPAYSEQQNTPKDRMSESGQDMATQAPESLQQAQQNINQAQAQVDPQQAAQQPKENVLPQPTKPVVRSQAQQPVPQQQQTPIQPMPQQQPKPTRAKRQPKQTPENTTAITGPTNIPVMPFKENVAPVVPNQTSPTSPQIVPEPTATPTANTQQPQFDDPQLQSRWQENASRIANEQAYFGRFKEPPKPGDPNYQPYQDRQLALQGSLARRDQLLKFAKQPNPESKQIVPELAVPSVANKKPVANKKAYQPKADEAIAKAAKRLDESQQAQLLKKYDLVQKAYEGYKGEGMSDDDALYEATLDGKMSESSVRVAKHLLDQRKGQSVNNPQALQPAESKADSTTKENHTPEILTQGVKDFFDHLVTEKYHRSGVVPIHEIRSMIRQKFGDEAASHKVLDPLIKQIRRDKHLDMFPITISSKATEQQLTDSVPGIGETHFYLERFPESERKKQVQSQPKEEVDPQPVSEPDPVDKEAKQLQTTLQRHLDPKSYTPEDVNKIIEHFSQKKLPEIQAILKAAGIDFAAKTKAGILKKLFLRLNASQRAQADARV